MIEKLEYPPAGIGKKIHLLKIKTIQYIQRKQVMIL